MEWEAPALVLDARPYGEGDVIATVMTEAHGRHRGLARGGGSRTKAHLWQAGNLLQLRWAARLSDQLGTFTGELVHPGAALAMDDPLSLAMLSAMCAVAEGALPEHEPHPRIFAGLLQLVPRVALGAPALTELIQWELLVLSDLGYGLDLSACAVTGRTEALAYVSPRTGRAVTSQGAGEWAARLLPLPAFLAKGDESAPDAPTPADWRDGLRLTGHFLERDAFGNQHRPLPLARRMLYDRVSVLAEQNKDDESHHVG
jgi:DNA repair protein RecO (recombination protein O)